MALIKAYCNGPSTGPFGGCVKMDEQKCATYTAGNKTIPRTGSLLCDDDELAEGIELIAQH